jgi:hypothetical protein
VTAMPHPDAGQLHRPEFQRVSVRMRQMCALKDLARPVYGVKKPPKKR